MTRSEWFGVSGTFLLITFLISVLIYGAKDVAQRDKQRMEHRKVLCDTLCPDGLWVEVYRQKIGYRAFEWRCLCEDGSWRPVP